MKVAIMEKISHHGAIRNFFNSRLIKLYNVTFIYTAPYRYCYAQLPVRFVLPNDLFHILTTLLVGLVEVYKSYVFNVPVQIARNMVQNYITLSFLKFL